MIWCKLLFSGLLLEIENFIELLIFLSDKLLSEFEEYIM